MTVMTATRSSAVAEGPRDAEIFQTTAQLHELLNEILQDISSQELTARPTCS